MFKGTVSITKTYLYNFDPLKPRFYIVKLGFIGYTLIFLFPLKNIDCGYSFEPPRRGGSNEYPQLYVLSRNMKSTGFSSESFHFLVIQFSIHLNRRVFVMVCHYLFFISPSVGASRRLCSVIVPFPAHLHLNFGAPHYENKPIQIY